MISGSRSAISAARSSCCPVEPPTWASTPLAGMISSRVSSTRSFVTSEVGEPSGTTLISAAVPSSETCGAAAACTPSAADSPWWSATSRGSSGPVACSAPRSAVTSSEPFAPGPKPSVRRS
jgi:hypothetical protein